MDWLTMPRWSPYVVGVGIGILSWLTFLLSDKAIGCSTAFSRTIGLLEKMVAPRTAQSRPYYQKFAPVIDWEWMLVIGIFGGALLSTVLSDSWRITFVPSVWAAAFGSDPGLRMVFAWIGGVIIGLGARWAGGCTSGHSISGTMQLAVSSWLATACFFAAGIAAAFALYASSGQ